MKKSGPLRELNPGPPAPEAGIMPLDQVATVIGLSIEAPYVRAFCDRYRRSWIMNPALYALRQRMLKLV